MTLKILNLYAGIGGNRKLWGGDIEVTAVEINPMVAGIYKKYFPNDNVVVGDAEEYLIKTFPFFDFIWASPPCPTHSKVRFFRSKGGDYIPKMPDMTLYSMIIFLKHFCNYKKWVVENVSSYYKPLIEPAAKVGRHFFWSNFPIDSLKVGGNDTKIHEVTSKTNRFGFDLKKIDLGSRKDQIIRNCVNPIIGLHILECAFKRKQKQLNELIR